VTPVRGDGAVQATSTQQLLDAGQAAADRGDWDAAYGSLREADRVGRLVFDDLALLAAVAYASGDLDATIEAWERAHADRLAADDPVSAAMAATRIAMHLMMDTGLLAPVRAWTKRAERLLEGHDDAPVHAWLAVARAYERLLSGDFQAADRRAREASTIGQQQGVPGAHAMGRVAEARGVILAGDVARGLDLLDDAAVVAVSGEVDPLTVGLLYCELVCAWQGLAQYDRAEEWTEAMERWCQGHSMGSVRGRCRVHRAEILRLRGESERAEDEALAACSDLRPTLRREFGWPLSELGRIRLQRGDLDGAEAAFLEAYEAGWEPQPGYALLLLARGAVHAAVASIEDALAHPSGIPSKELPPSTELRRAPLLGALVEISVAAGDPDRARHAADELARIAVRFDSEALEACAATACAQVALADGELTAARERFDRAVRLWSQLSAPYEAGQARLGLAETHRRSGDDHHASLEFRAARSIFERIGARGAARVARRSGDASTSAAPRPGATGGGPLAQTVPGTVGVAPASVDRGVFRRDGDYWSIGYQGDTRHLRDLRGLHYLARLLAEPGREFHAADLVAWEVDVGRARRGPKEPALTGADLRGGRDAGEVLDAPAKAAYRRRLAEIEQDIHEAEQLGDQERASRAAVDRDYLVRELANAVGLGGRERRVGSAAERARASVTRAVRHAMRRIEEHHPTLGEHLDRTIRTGTYCSYQPDPHARITWES
jgi:tetratricopeptide (TPR) repeat protein